MNIMHKRPLSLILCISLCGFVLFSYLDAGFLKNTIALLAIISLALSITVLIIRKRGAFYLLTSVVLCLSLIFSYIYFDLWFQADKRFSEECCVTGTVTEESREQTYSLYKIKADGINGESLSGYTLSVLISRSDAEKAEIEVGSKLKFKCKLNSTANHTAYGFRYFSAYGINAFADNVKDMTHLGTGEIPLASRLSDIREFLTRHAKMLTNEECGAFLSALIFGERDALSSDVALDFSRIGISHVLALSGMHLSVLALGINALLSLLRVKKKWRVLTVILFASVYTLFTGLSVTVVRAAIMLIISSLLYLIGAEQDSVTSLSVAVAVIIIFSPYSVFSISLWLSALATLGVITSAEWISRLELPKAPLSRLWRGILNLFVPSIFAISATLLITSIAFGGVSTVSLFATVIFSFLSEVIMYLGTLTLIFGRVIPFSYILIPITEYTLGLADAIADCRYVYASADFLPYIILAVLLTLVFYIFLFIKTKKQGVFVTLISSLLILCFCAAMLSFAKAEPDTVYSSGEECDLILLKSDSQTSLIVNSTNKRGTGKLAYNSLRHDGAAALDTLVYTSYSFELPSEAEELLSRVLVYEIRLPEPQSSEERDIYRMLCELAEKFGTRLALYRIGESNKLGEHEFTLLCASRYGEGFACAQFITYRERALLYLSDGFTKESLPEELSGIYAIADTFIVGGCGKGYKEEQYISTETDTAKDIVISAENLYFAQNSYAYYKENGCRITLHPQYISLFE